MITDPIADTLTRIRNALALKYKNVEVNHSNLIQRIIQIFYNIGYIDGFKILTRKNSKVIIISLKYDIDGNSVIHGVKRVSKPSLRVYAKANSIPVVYNGLGTSIVSTSLGLVTTYKAKQKNKGGEIICFIW